MNEDMINVRRIYPAAKQKKYEHVKKFWVIYIRVSELAETWLGVGVTPKIAWKNAWGKIAIGMVRRLEQ